MITEVVPLTELHGVENHRIKAVYYVAEKVHFVFKDRIGAEMPVHELVQMLQKIIDKNREYYGKRGCYIYPMDWDDCKKIVEYLGG